MGFLLPNPTRTSAAGSLVRREQNSSKKSRQGLDADYVLLSDERNWGKKDSVGETGPGPVVPGKYRTAWKSSRLALWAPEGGCATARENGPRGKIPLKQGSAGLGGCVAQARFDLPELCG